MAIRSFHRSRGGFTVLEVMVALTVFGLVSLVVFSVFSAAVRTQATGQRESELISRARFALDSVERDTTNIFFRDETSYNIEITRQIEEMEAARLQAEANSSWEDFYTKYGDPNDPENTGSVGNPYDQGRIVDLQMAGEDNGKLDSLTFAVRHPLNLGGNYRPLGISRVKYFVEKGWLVRSEDNVEAPARNAFGETVGQARPPLYTRLAEAVTGFDISYTFWYDSQWYEVEKWNSSNRLIKNPRQVFGDYWADQRREEADSGAQADTSIKPGDPGWNDFLNDQTTEPLDRLPSAIRVKLTLSDPQRENRTATFERIIKVLPAEETYTPWPELAEDDRENEREQRDQAYHLVFPGISGSNR